MKKHLEVIVLSGFDDGDLEVEDDGPDEAESELRVALDDVLGTDVH